MVKVYFLTSNYHKLMEARKILGGYGIEVEPIKGEKVEIQSPSLIEVVKFAAEYIKDKILQRPLLIEDSGLFIEALRGFPGPFSHYVYDTIGLEGVLKLLKDVENRKAHFEAAVACLCTDDRAEVSTGRVYGKIAHMPKGTKGFGFDPIFVPEGYDRTFAELGDEVKNKISHRAKALRAIALRITELYR